ncbi:hypothetical protein COU60_03975 [Candidatus Pacearchaeota archaeon CG10_big_fil_rev_8_21_14_0_10_34_76]|nr:MAG: hypothetical protein COU60_03975 [Candidatus Pacearchaeota archaeon CG10_big_fil_rev_8_21_14_0_10_34_76]
MTEKLDLYDKKLLYELDKDSSQSVTALAKKLRRSKQFILYRMKKLEESGIITGYHAIIDMSKLGYFTFRVYFKFQQTTQSEGEEFVQHVRERLKQVWTITSMHGKWDYALFLGVRTIEEFHKIWDDIMLQHKEKIKSYNVAVYAPVYNFNRKFFLDRVATGESIERIYGSGEKENIDEKELRLIEAYANNVRLSSLELSSKAKMSPETIRKKIKELQKRKVIVGYKIGLNLEKIGYVSYRVDLHLISTKKNKELFEFCRHHKNIYQVNKSIGGADFEIEAVVKDFLHLIELINEIKNKFKDVVNDIDYFGFSTFHILQFIPD